MSQNEITLARDTIQQAASPSVIATITRAELETGMELAHKFPRSVSTFMEKSRSMACLSPKVAQSCIYSLPRGGKQLTGPSIRLAEIAMSAWGNIRVATRLLDIGDEAVTVAAWCKDLETGAEIATEERRSILKKDGSRFNQDMIELAIKSASSIARRNAIFAIVGRAFIDDLYDQCRACVAGSVKSLEQSRDESVSYFGKLGVTKERLLNAIGRAGVADITVDDVVDLRGLAKQLKDGELTLEQAFPPIVAAGPDPLLKPKAETSAPQQAEEATFEQPAPEKAPEKPAKLTPATRAQLDSVYSARKLGQNQFLEACAEHGIPASYHKMTEAQGQTLLAHLQNLTPAATADAI